MKRILLTKHLGQTIDVWERNGKFSYGCGSMGSDFRFTSADDALNAAKKSAKRYKNVLRNRG